MKRLIIAITACLLLLASCGPGRVEPTPPRLISHAGGAIWGLRYTNTLEAMDSSYADGHRYIELDLERTSDGKIVLLHDWEAMKKRMFGISEAGPMTHDEFMSADTLAGLTVMDMGRLKEWLSDHPDAFVVTDVKEGNLEIMAELKTELGNEFSQLIPQAYSFEEYDELISRGTEHVILTTYAIFDKSAEQIEEFVTDRRPFALTMPTECLEAGMLARLSAAGIATYTHTVNDLGTYESWREAGLYGIYTDYFRPAIFEGE